MATDAQRLAGRDLENDLTSFHLVKYGPRVDGFLATAKNSGTHWLRYMASHAIARHLDLAPPAHSSGPDSDVFIGHPKHARVHPQAPRIGSSHNIPSRLIAPLARAGLVRLPPTVVLVRHMRQALLSYYVKWKDEYPLGTLAEFLRRPAPGVRKIDDVWWFIRFFNRWGELAAAMPDRVIVVRHEDLQRDPGGEVARVWAHWGVTLSAADQAAAVAVAGREAVAATLDPRYGETIVPDAEKREAVALSVEDEVYLAGVLKQHLKHDFGYGLI
ncbi:MAG: sulfotransferase domain-containing protein [Caulobacter sp.]